MANLFAFAPTAFEGVIKLSEELSKFVKFGFRHCCRIINVDNHIDARKEAPIGRLRARS